MKNLYCAPHLIERNMEPLFVVDLIISFLCVVMNRNVDSVEVRGNSLRESILEHAPICGHIDMFLPRTNHRQIFRQMSVQRRLSPPE